MVAENKRSRLVQLLTLGAVLLVGIGVGVGVSRLTGGSEHSAAPPTTAGVTRAGDPDALAELPPLNAPIAPEQATSPEQAVSGFLTAEAKGDFMASYAFLAAADHEVFATPAIWVQAHGDFPVVTGFKIQSAAAEADGVRVTTLTGYEPGLDEVLGLTTARARSSWMTVQENGLWRVVFSRSSDQKLYPGDAAATDVAREWAQRRIACQPTDELEDNLKDSSVLGQGLCKATGELRIGGLSQLSQVDDTDALVAAYGPDVFTWARVVPITSPKPLQIVLAAIGPDWKVVGVIRQRL